MSFTVRRDRSTWRIDIRRAEIDAAPVMTFDGKPWQDEAFPFVDDQSEHRILFQVPARPPVAAQRQT
jgi:hypothetical protein